MKEKLEVLISIFIIFLCIFINIVFEMKEQIIIIILNINIFYLSYRLKEEKKNIMIFYFTICNFLFNTSIALTSYLNGQYILNSMFFTQGIPFDKEISKFIYELLIINSIGILIGILLIYFKKDKKNITLKENKLLLNFLFYIFCLSFGYVFIENIEYVKKVIKIGYAASYRMENIKTFSYYLITLFNFLIIIYLSLKPSFKIKMKIILTLYIFLLFISSFSGSRGVFLIGLVFFIWYLEVLEKFKIKKRHMVILAFLIFIYSDIISTVRESYGDDLNVKSKINMKIIEMPKKFLESQNGTAQMLGYIKKFPEIIDGENYGKMIFSSFYIFYNSFFNPEINLVGKIDENIGKKVSNFSRVSYIVNSKFVKEGYGVGGNYIIEMYEISKELGVFLFSILFVFIIYYLENIFKKNTSIYKNIFIILVFQKIFYAPRSHYFDFNIRMYIYICIMYFTLLKCIKILEIYNRRR